MSAVRQRPSLGQLLPDLIGTMAETMAEVVPSDLTLDSRSVKRGDAFVAVPGTTSDGRRHIGAAVDSGAAAILAEAEGLSAWTPDADTPVVPVHNLASRLGEIAGDFYGNPSRQMALVAVTGTNGKTSVVDFVRQILRGLGVAAGSIGTLGARLTAPVTEAANTTPDVISLNRQLAEWLDAGVDHVALEASSHALDQGRLAGLSIQSAVFTNLSRDHLDYHGDEQSYARAKLSLFEDFQLRRAIFNADDVVARRVRGLVDCPAMGISLDSAESDVYVQVQQALPLTFRIHTPLGTQSVSAPLTGSFNAFNLAAAMMAVSGLGYSFEAVVDAAARVSAVPGRMEPVLSNRGFQVVVDYAHTPDALARALAALRAETAGNLWVVFGCGGDRDAGKRALMGAEAARLADRLVVTSDNPRSEHPGKIIDDVLAGTSVAAERIPDRRQAIAFALEHAEEGDCVLIAGKGHEAYQETAGVRTDFSDVNVAQKLLAESAA